LYISLTGGFQVAEQEYQFSIRKVKENVETAGGGVAIQYYPKS
jgi:hypothetical protein